MEKEQISDLVGDAGRAFAVLEAGGIAILPMDVGYSLIGGSAGALTRIFESKRRGVNKLNAMLADLRLHNEIHEVGSRGREVVRVLVEEYNLPLGAIAPARMDHPIFHGRGAQMLHGSTKTGTILMLLNAGPFHQEICRLSRDAGLPLFGSSANLSLTGTKFRVADIEPEIRDIADIIIDHGLRKYHLYQASSTLLNLETLEVVRFGACYELIADALARHLNVHLPPPPSGHLDGLVGHLVT